MRNFYKILGVSPNDDTDVIIKAYNSRIKYYRNKDRSTDPNIDKKMKICKEAFDVLSSYHKRRQYDTMLLRELEQQRMQNTLIHKNPFQSYFDNFDKNISNMTKEINSIMHVKNTNIDNIHNNAKKGNYYIKKVSNLISKDLENNIITRHQQMTNNNGKIDRTDDVYVNGKKTSNRNILR